MEHPNDDAAGSEARDGHGLGRGNDSGEVDPPQCRICLDSDEEMGRLIKPCLCRGSISYVHVKCLNRWRESSQNAFFSCPQCHYRYNFQRTKVLGIATNPIVVGAVTSVFFTIIVLTASFVTTTFTSLLSPQDTYDIYYSPYWVNPYTAFIDLVRAALRVLQDGVEGFDLDELLNPASPSPIQTALEPPGLVRRLLRRFLLGLPVVGAGSLVHMLFSVGLGPVQWLARYRGGNRRNRRNNTTDTATIILVALLLVGALRAVWKVYQWTERWTKQLLLRAEDIILEVN